MTMPRLSFADLAAFDRRERKQYLQRLFGGNGGGTRANQNRWRRHKMMHRRRKEQR